MLVSATSSTGPNASPNASPSASPNELFNFKVKTAHSLYAAFQAKTQMIRGLLEAQDGKKANSVLADQLLEHAKEDLKNYSFTEWNNLPYEINFIESKLGLSHTFIKGNSSISFITLIFNKTFSLYLRNRIDPETHDVYEVSNVVRHVLSEKIPCCKTNPDLENGFVIFLSHRNIRMLPPPFSAGAGEHKYYFYRAPVQEPIKLKEARASVTLPFHHEDQIDGHCGLHALNAYLGCQYFTAEHLRDLEKLRNSMGNPGSDTEWQAEDFESSSPKSSRETPIHSNAESKTETSAVASHEPCVKLNGSDTGFLRYVLDQIAQRPGAHHIIPIGIQTNAVQRKKLLDHIKLVDRFILGRTKDRCAHALAFRRDSMGKWWRVDSKNNWQDSFADEEELYEVIKEEFSNNHLSFIVPKDENIMYKRPRAAGK